MSGGDLKFWGIDGCPCGWFCVGLGAGDSWDCFLAKDIGEAHEKLRQRNAKLALIDIPIGLPDKKGKRECDTKARQFVVGRRSSVFSVPCRQAVEAYRNASGDKFVKEEVGRRVSETVGRGPLSKQTWGIVPKIAEVDSFLCENKDAQEFFREMHPEVCFCAFNGKPLSHAKKLKSGKINPEGMKERKRILKTLLPEAEKIFDDIRNCYQYGVGDDDILDALAGALTAKFVNCGKYKTLPSKPSPDLHDLPMQMLCFLNQQNSGGGEGE